MKRRILKYTGIALLVLVAVVAIYVLMVMVTLPRTSGPETMSEGSCEDVAGLGQSAAGLPQQRVLVTYASKYSSTAGVAQVVMETLCHEGFAVDLRWIENAATVDAYDAVVVGSPIYWGFWLAPATDFLAQHQEALADKTLAYFILANAVREGKNTPENRQKAQDMFIQPVVDDFPALKPSQNFGLFGGRLKRSTLSKFETFAMDMAGFEDNDSRDFNQVENWSKEIGEEIAARSQAGKR